MLVVALLAATAVAFALTEHLKLEPSPIFATRVDPLFSPVCDCPSGGRSSRIAFRLRKRDRLTLEIVDRDEHPVAEIAAGQLGPGPLEFAWDGRDDQGRVVANGVYRARVRLADDDRTLVFPNPIRVDATPPRIAVVAVRPREFSPDGDGHSDRITIGYRMSERAHPMLFVNGRRRLLGFRQRPRGVLVWHGRRAGRGLPSGDYRLTLAARDAARNLSVPTRPFVVRIRYVDIVPAVLRVRAGRRFGLRVSTDATILRWRFVRLRRPRAASSGLARRGEDAAGIVLRAPRRAGRYALTLLAAGRADRAVVIVRRRRS